MAISVFNPAARMLLKKTTGLANDLVTGLDSVTLGGMLVATKVGVNLLSSDDAIQMFNTTSYNLNEFSTNNTIPWKPGNGLLCDLSTLGTV